MNCVSRRFCNAKARFFPWSTAMCPGSGHLGPDPGTLTTRTAGHEIFTVVQSSATFLMGSQKTRSTTPGPTNYHSRTLVARFVDVRSEPPSHDGVSNLGHPRLLSWRGCWTSWSGTPPQGRCNGHVLLVAFLLANKKALSMRPLLQAE